MLYHTDWKKHDEFHKKTNAYFAQTLFIFPDERSLFRALDKREYLMIIRDNFC